MGEDGSMRVLLVEDDRVYVTLITGLMGQVESSRFDVTPVARVAAAVELLRQRRFDVVLLDLSLPDSHGLETLERVHAEAADVPIVILTGMDDEQMAFEALRQGAEDFLVKGRIDSAPLVVRAIRYAIERKRAEEEIHKLNAALEQRVTERTVELETANVQLQAEIEERRRIEQQLRRAFQNQLLALRAASIGHWTWDVAEDRINAGPGVGTLFGLPDGMALRTLQDAVDRIHVDDRAAVQAALRRALDPSGQFVAEFRILQPDGSRRWMLGHGEVERDATQRPLRIHGVVQDITEYKDAELSLRRSERLASLGTMAAGIAHEINNPVTAVLYSAEAALNVTEDRELIRECLQNVVTSAKRCSAVVEHVLRFAKPASSEKQPHDVNEVVRHAAEFTQNYAQRHGATLIFDCDEHLPRVLINAVELEQVLLNLIRNSVQAGEGNVEVTIRTQQSGQRVRLTVEDNGRGISEEVKRRAFDPFFSTRHDVGGTGLGLSIAHGIIQGHGGTIGIDGRLGQGTIVTIELPHSTDNR